MNINEDNEKVEEEMEDEPPKGDTKRRQAGKGPRPRPKNTNGSISSAKPTFKGETNAIRDHVFIYNQIHNKN